MKLHTLLLFSLAMLAGELAAGVPGLLEIGSRAGNVPFSHDEHAAVECEVCHHTSPGIRIKRPCRDCHTADSKLPRRSPEAFHDHCIACHLDLKKARQATGPAKRCSGCHP